jgi:hypothetical protein
MYVYFFPTFVFLCFLIFADKVNREMKVKIRKMFKNVPFEWLFIINYLPLFN